MQQATETRQEPTTDERGLLGSSEASGCARPILFSGPMIRAILAGKKTQTRRTIKPQPEMIFDGESLPDGSNYGGWEPDLPPWSRWPFQKEKHLWVRETWQQDPFGKYHYRADGHDLIDPITGDIMSWKPSIHMPRQASRITLEITGSRAERLTTISEADAISEGVTASIVGADFDHLKFRAGFASLWESVYGQGSWEVDPWVWVVSFRVV